MLNNVITVHEEGLNICSQNATEYGSFFGYAKIQVVLLQHQNQFSIRVNIFYFYSRNFISSWRIQDLFDFLDLREDYIYTKSGRSDKDLNISCL